MRLHEKGLLTLGIGKMSCAAFNYSVIQLLNFKIILECEGKGSC